jgi:hypothetical protein
MNESQKAMLKRLRRKLDIMLMDHRRNLQLSGDLRECIALTDMMERNDE